MSTIAKGTNLNKTKAARAIFAWPDCNLYTANASGRPSGKKIRQLGARRVSICKMASSLASGGSGILFSFM
jgi:hypothetical protein